MEQYRRLMSAGLLAPPVAIFLIYASRELFAILIGIVMWVSLYEFFQMLALKHRPHCQSVCYGLTLCLTGLTYQYGLKGLPLALSLSVIFLTGCSIFRAEADAPPLASLVHTLFGFLLIGWGLSHVILIRGLTSGHKLIVLLCAVVWIGDAAAMYTGKAFGQHRLAPLVSPGKTWEGALGSTLGSIIAALVGIWLLSLPLSISQAVIFGTVVSCVAQISDLAESLLKRYTGVKDSGALIPGHGGLLDRIDGLFLAAPVAFYVLLAMVPDNVLL